MAYDFAGGGADERITATSAPSFSLPMTMAIWFWLDASSGFHQLCSLHDTTNEYFGLGTVGGNLAARAQDSSGGESATIAEPATGGWHHALGIFNSATDRQIYLDGVAGTQSTASHSPATPTDIEIGAHFNGSAWVGDLDGRLCEFAVWDVALDAAERAALAAGYSAELIRPTSLIESAHLIRELNTRTGTALSTGGSPSVIQHTRMIYPSRSRWVPIPAGGATTFQESMAGSLTASGALVRQAQKAVAGAMAPAGSLTKQTAKAFAGSITPTGTLSAIRTVLLSAAGSIAASGALTLQAGKELAGSIAPTGTLARRTDKTMAGSVTATGALATVRTVLISLAGTLAPTGSLTKRALKTMTGSLAPTGSLTKRVSKLLVGTLAALGSLVTTGAVVAYVPVFPPNITTVTRVWRVSVERQWRTDSDRTWRTDG